MKKQGELATYEYDGEYIYVYSNKPLYEKTTYELIQLFEELDYLTTNINDYIEIIFCYGNEANIIYHIKRQLCTMCYIKFYNTKTMKALIDGCIDFNNQKESCMGW